MAEDEVLDEEAGQDTGGRGLGGLLGEIAAVPPWAPDPAWFAGLKAKLLALEVECGD